MVENVVGCGRVRLEASQMASDARARGEAERGEAREVAERRREERGWCCYLETMALICSRACGMEKRREICVLCKPTLL